MMTPCLFQEEEIMLGLVFGDVCILALVAMCQSGYAVRLVRGGHDGIGQYKNLFV